MTSETNNSNAKPAWITPIESRKERAEYYFQTVLDGQQKWYSNNAKKRKRQYLAFAILVIVLGALISVIQVVEADWARYLTAVLGAAVAVFRAIDTLLRPGETWNAYRKASETMKREYRLYLGNADLYAEAPDEEAAYRLLVERVETAIAEEQQLFWQSHAKNVASQPAPNRPRNPYELSLPDV